MSRSVGEGSLSWISDNFNLKGKKEIIPCIKLAYNSDKQVGEAENERQNDNIQRKNKEADNNYNNLAEEIQKDMEI